MKYQRDQLISRVTVLEDQVRARDAEIERLGRELSGSNIEKLVEASVVQEAEKKVTQLEYQIDYLSTELEKAEEKISTMVGEMADKQEELDKARQDAIKAQKELLSRKDHIERVEWDNQVIY